MAKALTSASKCVPAMINLSSIEIRSCSPICRSYSIEHGKRNPVLIRNRILDERPLFYYDPIFLSRRPYATQPKGFFGSLFDNIKEEFGKNKEIKDNIKKFRDQAKKLEDSDALKEARDKYKTLERETMKSSAVLKEKIGEFSEKVKESDVLKKASDIGVELGKHAQKAAGKLSETTGQIADTQTYKSVSQKLSTLKHEVGDVTKLTRPLGYHPPTVLRKRSDVANPKNEKVFTADTETQTVTLHKDSQWFQRWQNFKENNAYLNKMFDLKSKYDESDNPFIRITRSLTDKVSGAVSSLFSQTEISETLTEICRIEPTFDLANFVVVIQHDILPNIFESLARGELEILRDWCSESMYNILVHPITVSKATNHKYHLNIIDLSDVEFEGAKMMDTTPVVIVRFQVQQTVYLTNAAGKVVEGDPDKIIRMNYVFAFGRDPSILDSSSAWRLVDLAAFPANHFV